VSPQHGPGSAIAGLRHRRETLAARLREEQPRRAPVDIAFRLLRRDTHIAGGILGGGMAYRLFFWTLALAVLVAGGLGFVPGSRVSSAAGQAGITKQVAVTVGTAARQSHGNRWALLVIGVALVIITSWAVLRTLRLIHAAVWQVPVPRVRRAPQALGAVVVGPFVLALLAGLTGWVRSHTDLLGGLVAMALWGGVAGLLWLLASLRLPRREAPWTALIPGAVLVAVGAVGIHAVTAYYLATKLATASALYGTLGLTATMLVYLYMFGRLVVVAAELNAVMWERASGLRPADSGGFEP
jgi:uncharacterized BrkB/YihY/UPF0761 family membrane protein